MKSANRASTRHVAACRHDDRGGRHDRLPVVCVAAVILSLALPLQGRAEFAPVAPDDEHGGEPALVTDPALTLTELLQQTAARHPQAGLLDARARRVDAETELSERWLPDSTRLSGYRLTDRPLDDTALVEDEVALNLPLWMPGERRARGALASALSTGLHARTAEFRWQVSGELRQSLWAVVIARRDWELARGQEARLSGVLRETQTLEQAGDVARGDRLAVEQELAQWRAESFAREARYRDAVRGYRALTGAAALPEQVTEAQSALHVIDDRHPALQAARDRIAEASAALDVVREGNTTRPSLQVFWRANRPEQRSPRIDALGIGFEIPLGRSPSRAPDIAQANEQIAGAEADYLARRRQLELDLHEAVHRLHTLDLQLANSETLLAAASERQSIDSVALELGEISMREWLRRQAEFKDIERSHELLRLQRDAAVAAYNQAVGESL